MKIIDTFKLATELMDQHGLIEKGWSFDFDRAKRRFGYCSYKEKKISLSADLVELNDESHIKNTILHEIAHAIAGPKAHHSRKWKYVAYQIGANPVRCYSSEVVQPKHKWVGTCPNGHQIFRMKRMRLSCSRCRPVFDLSYLFDWTPAE